MTKNGRDSKKVITLETKDDQEAKSILASLSERQVLNIMKYIGGELIKEVANGVYGKLEYEGYPFFEVIDRIYENARVKGCYFCDRDIDGNEIPFNYPEETELCLSCQLKVANLLKAFDIDPETLFPGMAKREIQPVIYDLEDKCTPSSHLASWSDGESKCPVCGELLIGPDGD